MTRTEAERHARRQMPWTLAGIGLLLVGLAIGLTLIEGHPWIGGLIAVAGWVALVLCVGRGEWHFRQVVEYARGEGVDVDAMAARRGLKL